MEQITKILKDLWLKENEVKVYLASISMWPQVASLIWKKTNIARSNTQYICWKLVEKWLLSMIETPNGNVYSPKDPEKILTMLNKEYNKIDKKMQKANSIISDLKQLKNPYSKVPKVKYYTWVDWIIEMFEDVFKVNQDIYWAIDITDDIHPKILDYLNNDYTIKRSRTRIHTKVLFNDNKKSKKYRENDELVNRVSLLVPEQNFPFDTCTHIYWNKVAYFSYKKWDMTWVIIENENIKNAALSLFKLAWNYATNFETNKKYKDILL